MTAERSFASGFRAARYVGHFALLALAFPLTWLASGRFGVKPGWPWAEAACLACALAGAMVVPRTAAGSKLLKPGEGATNGICMYFLGLAAAFLLFPAYAVGAGWAALAAGDAAAGAIGSLLPSSRLQWNRDKSWMGMAAFALAAIPACALLLWWCPAPTFLTKGGQPEYQYVWTLAVIAGISGAMLESAAFPLDDNFRIPVGTALAVWLAATFLNAGTSGMPEHRAFQPEWFLHGLGVSAAICAAVFAAGFASLPAAVAAWMIGSVAYFFTLKSGYALLAASAGFSMAAVAMSRAFHLAAVTSARGAGAFGREDVPVPGRASSAPPPTSGARTAAANAIAPMPAGPEPKAPPNPPAAPASSAASNSRAVQDLQTAAVAPAAPDAPAASEPPGKIGASEAPPAAAGAPEATGTAGEESAAQPAGGVSSVTLVDALSFLAAPAVCAVLYPASKGHPAALIAYAGALCAATAFAAFETGAAYGRSGRNMGTAAIFRPLCAAAALAAVLLFCGAAWGFGFWTVAVSGHERNAPAAGFMESAILSAVMMVSGFIGGGAGGLALALAGPRAPAFVWSVSRLAAASSGAVIAGAAGILFPCA